MIAVTYTIELLEPLLATSLDGDPNTKASHGYIPGSLIRGALIYLHLQGKRHQPIKADVESKDFTLKHSDEAEQRLFLCNTTRYLNAYPLIYPPAEAIIGVMEDRPYRLLPLPQSLQIPKKKSLEPNGTVAYMVTAAEFQQPAVQLTGIGKSFYLPTTDTLYVHSPDRQLAVHTARERKQGRATEADGAVFQYDALSPGQTFGGHILVSTADDADMLVKLLKQAGELWLGGSRSAGYGHVRVTAYRDDHWQNEVALFPQTKSAAEVDEQNSALYENEEDDEYDSLNETDESNELIVTIGSSNNNGDLQPSEQFTITCLSHCLVRDESGQPSTEIRYVLAAALQVPVTALQPDLAHTHRTMTLVGGFNRTWGLPLPQLPAIAAGSVFTFTTQQIIKAKDIQAIVDDGIGELRLDGLGRIALNWLPKTDYKIKSLESIRAPGDVPTIHPVNQPFAQRIGERILRRELDEALINAVAGLRLHTKSLESVSKSQLSRLRTLLREQYGWWQQQTLSSTNSQETTALVEKCLSPIIQYLDNLKRPAQKQLQTTYLEKGRSQVRLSVWLDECLQNCRAPKETGWPNNLAMPSSIPLGNMPVITVPNIWRVEYTLRLIDGVLAQAAKQIEQSKSKSDLTDSDTFEAEVTA